MKPTNETKKSTMEIDKAYDKKVYNKNKNIRR
jgi:hypothetical protein